MEVSGFTQEPTSGTIDILEDFLGMLITVFIGMVFECELPQQLLSVNKRRIHEIAHSALDMPHLLLHIRFSLEHGC